MQLLEQAQALLNFDGQATFDVNVLDAVINTMYRGQGDAVSDRFKSLEIYFLCFCISSNGKQVKY
jgi:hypothetical protein